MTGRTGPAQQAAAVVWLLWDHGNLRGIYRHGADADHDAAALRQAAVNENARPPSPDAITVRPAELRPGPRW